MQAKDQDDRLSIMPISAQPGASPPSPSKNENILKTKVFLTFLIHAHGLLAAYPDLSKVPFYSTLPKKKAARTST